MSGVTGWTREASGEVSLDSTAALPLGAQRMVSRHWHDEALPRMQRRATLEAMRLRRSTVEHPLATLKFISLLIHAFFCAVVEEHKPK